MTEKLQQTIKEEVAKLPKEMQGAINTLNWLKIVEEIGQKYSLDEIDINNFQVETLLVLTGITDIQFYAINIENQVETTKDTAEKIATEATQKIFTPISNILLENIKKATINKDTSWQQNLDFVLSGGNYSSFMTPARIVPIEEKEKIITPKTTTIKITPVPPTPPPTLADIQARAARVATKSPLLNNKETATPIPIKPKQMTDITRKQSL